jgi:hypothetical protein
MSVHLRARPFTMRRSRSGLKSHVKSEQARQGFECRDPIVDMCLSRLRAISHSASCLASVLTCMSILDEEVKCAKCRIPTALRLLVRWAGQCRHVKSMTQHRFRTEITVRSVRLLFIFRLDIDIVRLEVTDATA